MKLVPRPKTESIGGPPLKIKISVGEVLTPKAAASSESADYTEAESEMSENSFPRPSDELIELL